MANPKFTSIKNDYCIVFETNSQIIEVEDDGSIALQNFDFAPIKSIEHIGHMKSLDVIGVIIDITDQETVKLKNKAQKFRKYITIVDESSCSISITLWGEMCEKNNNF